METLRPSQEQGAAFLAAHPVAILADDTGLGKSAQAIRAADAINARRILILCQAIGRVSWALEIPKWQTIERQVIQFGADTKSIPPGPVAVVAAFDTLSRKPQRTRLQKLAHRSMIFDGFDVVIIDEAHHLANPKSNRTKAIYGAKLHNDGLIEDVLARSTWLMSATLQRKNASELYPHLAALFPAILAKLFGYVPRLDDFVARYCIVTETPFGPDIVGNNPDTIGELREALRPFILRRSKKDVAGELGEVNRITLPLEVKPVATPALDLLLAGDENNDYDFAEDAAASTERRLLGLAKVDAAVEWISEFLEADPTRKLVVFAHHRGVLAVLEAALSRFAPVSVHGGVAPGLRARNVHEFQTNPAVRLFIGQNVAAGTSITLTAASDVLLLEPSGIPADNHQAVSRAHRIGQTEPVTAYFGFAAGTADEKIARRAKRRAEDFDQLMGPLTAPANGA